MYINPLRGNILSTQFPGYLLLVLNYVLANNQRAGRALYPRSLMGCCMSFTHELKTPPKPFRYLRFTPQRLLQFLKNQTRVYWVRPQAPKRRMIYFYRRPRLFLRSMRLDFFKYYSICSTPRYFSLFVRSVASLSARQLKQYFGLSILVVIRSGLRVPTHLITQLFVIKVNNNFPSGLRTAAYPGDIVQYSVCTQIFQLFLRQFSARTWHKSFNKVLFYWFRFFTSKRVTQKKRIKSLQQKNNSIITALDGHGCWDLRIGCVYWTQTYVNTNLVYNGNWGVFRVYNWRYTT